MNPDEIDIIVGEDLTYVDDDIDLSELEKSPSEMGGVAYTVWLTLSLGSGRYD